MYYSFWFQSVANTAEEDSDEDGQTDASSVSGKYQGSGGGDIDDSIKRSSKSTGSQTLLFVHQEKWQQDLLSKYGSDLTMIDATYRTTKYDIPLFFLVVPTNVGYIVVAEFCTQSEGTEDIAEALQVSIFSWCFSYMLRAY